MNELKQILSKESPYLFFVKFLAAFILLYLFFPFYRGLTGEGGQLYSSFLDNHLNIVKGFSFFLTKAANVLITSAGYVTNQNDYHTLRIAYSPGVVVNPSCLGWGVMSFWFAFVYANKGSVRHKLKWTSIGLAFIISLNIFRIALIALASHLHWSAITTLDHHQTFNIASYGCIFILMYSFSRYQKKYEGIRFGSTKKGSLRAV